MENPLENEYHLRKQRENLEVNRKQKPMTGEQVRRQALLLKVGFSARNKALSLEELEVKAADLNMVRDDDEIESKLQNPQEGKTNIAELAIETVRRMINTLRKVAEEKAQKNK